MGFFSKVFQNPIFRVAAPLALSFLAPGLGTALGSGILGAGAAGASTLGNALIGGGIGALTGGGLKGAALGAVGGGIAPNLGDIGSGINNFATENIPGLSGLESGISSLGSGISSGASNLGSSLSDAFGFGGGSSNAIPFDQVGKLQGVMTPAEDSFIASSRAGLSAPTATGTIGGGLGGGSTFNLGSAIASGLGGVGQSDAIKKAQQQLLSANQQQQANLGTFDPSKITSDPGYQFNLDQGNLGLQRELAASGQSQSGGALKAASQFNQNYASNAFNNYYQRWLNQTGAQNQLVGNAGNIGAQGTVGQANNLSSALSGVLNPTSGVNAQSLLALLSKQNNNPFAGA